MTESASFPQSNQVKLEIFEGPLDLLLFLIKKNDLNVQDIPISQITSEFLQYLDMMKDLNLNVAGEFLVMAATLMQIKARTLLPAPSREEEEAVDPRADLVNRLLEYQRYKEASRRLEGRLAVTKDVHFRGTPLIGESDFTMEASLFDLLDAFRDVLKNLRPRVREIESEDVPIEVKIRSVLDFLSSRPYATFREILERETSRRGLIITFLAILELIRIKQIVARQSDVFSEIRVYRREALPEHLAVEASDAEPEVRPSAVLPEDEPAPELPPADAPKAPVTEEA